MNYHVPTSTEYEIITWNSEIYACNSVQKKNTMQTGTKTQNRMGLSCLLNLLDHFKTPFFICFFLIIVLNPLWFISRLNIFIKISPSANLISKKEAKYVCKSRITYEDLERNWIHRKLGRNVLTCPGENKKSSCLLNSNLFLTGKIKNWFSAPWELLDTKERKTRSTSTCFCFEKDDLHHQGE